MSKTAKRYVKTDGFDEKMVGDGRLQLFGQPSLDKAIGGQWVALLQKAKNGNGWWSGKVDGRAL